MLLISFSGLSEKVNSWQLAEERRTKNEDKKMEIK